MFPLLVRRLALIFFVLVALYLSTSNLLGLIQQGNLKSPKPDYISKWEIRLKPLRQKLPSNATDLGYLTDSDLGKGVASSGELVEFFLTQYVLSPHVVHRGANSAWIIGNFSSKNFAVWLQKNIGSYEIQDIGSGIYLIHRTKK